MTYIITQAVSSRGGRVFTGVGLFVCFFRHNIWKIDAARITKLDIEMFYREPWKLIYFPSKRWNGNSRGTKDSVDVGFGILVSAGFFWLLIFCSRCVQLSKAPQLHCRWNVNNCLSPLNQYAQYGALLRQTMSPTAFNAACYLVYCSACWSLNLRRVIKASQDSVGDGRLRLRCRHLTNSTKRVVFGRLRFSTFVPLYENLTSYTRPKVHNISHCCQSMTESRPLVTYVQTTLRNLTVVFETCERTDRHTDTLTTILRTPTGSAVIMNLRRWWISTISHENCVSV